MRVLAPLLLLAAACSPAPPPPTVKPKVNVVVLGREAVANQVESFGALSFVKKTDLTNVVEGTVERLLAVEGAFVRRGQALVVLKNPQLDLRKVQADAALGSARSAVTLAQARLREGQLQVQVRLLAVDKAGIELEEKKLEWEESQRTFSNKEQLLAAGGTTQEALNGLKLQLASQELGYRSLTKEWETRRVGLRDEDLAAAGLPQGRDPAERLNGLVELNTATLAAELEAARTRVAAAQTEVQSAQSLLDELTVSAPMDGIVGARFAEAGEHVTAGTKLLTLIDTRSVFAVFPLQEDAAVAVGPGMATEVVLDAFPGESFGGRVEFVSPLIDAQSGSVSVKAKLDNPKARFKPGMFARVRVVLGPPVPVLVVPQSAVADKNGNRARIFAVVNARVHAKEVELGKDQGGRYVVLAGAAENDLVVDSPSPLLKEGEEVDVR